MHQGVFLHGMHGAANLQGNREGIRVIRYRANQVPHRLAGELSPFDTWCIMQELGKPGEKEAEVHSSFSRIAEGSPICSRLRKFVLERLAGSSNCLHQSHQPSFFVPRSWCCCISLIQANVSASCNQIVSSSTECAGCPSGGGLFACERARLASSEFGRCR